MYPPQEDAEPKHQFTGYWIPKELTQLGLSKTEQLLLSIIDSLTAPAPDYCFASNAYLAKQMDLSESRISYYITKFKRMKLIEEVCFNGRRRRMRTLKHNWYPVPPDDPKKELCAKSIKQPDSKKELCVKSRTQTTRNHEGRLRENANHIEKKIKNNINLSVVVAGAPPSNDQKSEVEVTKKESHENQHTETSPKPSESPAVESKSPNECKDLANKENEPERALILNPNGTRKELTQTDLFLMALSKKSPFTTETLQKAWIVLCKYEKTVYDWWKFIEGTAENIEKKARSEAITDHKKCKKKTTSKKSNHSEDSLKECKKTSSETGSLVPPSPKLTSVADLVPNFRRLF